jgi:hypothetical protein
LIDGEVPHKEENEMIVNGIVMRQPQKQNLVQRMYEACEKKFTSKSMESSEIYDLAEQIVEAYIAKSNLEQLSHVTGLDTEFLNEIIDECDHIFNDAAVEQARREKRNSIFQLLMPSITGKLS